MQKRSIMNKMSRVLCLSFIIVLSSNILLLRNASAADIEHIGTKMKYSPNDRLSIERPSDTKVGDLLLLFVHRTDDELLDSLSGWKLLVQCDKDSNEDDNCSNIGGASDLGQSVFWNDAGSSGAKTYNLDLGGSHPTWAVLTTLRNANIQSPMRDSATKGCDNDPNSRFPSVSGNIGDWLIMSQSFDDRVSSDKFNAPSGATKRGYVYGSDEAGFLYTKRISQNGETGVQETTGQGGPNCKDALVSLTIKKK